MAGEKPGGKPGSQPGEKPGSGDAENGQPDGASTKPGSGGNSPIRQANNRAGNQVELPPGLYWMQLGGNADLKEVAKALQVKIQEAILAAALQDSDEPVPPEYKQLVDEYYKALSDDLR